MKIIMRSFVLSLCFLLLTGFTARDPRVLNETALSRDTFWVPPKKPRPPELCKLELPDPCEELALERLIDIALSNNPLTAEAWRGARAQAYEYRKSQSIYYPQIDFQETYSYSQVKSSGSAGGGVVAAADANTDVQTNTGDNTIVVGGGGGGGGFANLDHFEQFNTQFTMSYLLLDFGGREGTVAAALHVLKAANWTHNRVIQDVMINVLNNYYLYAGNLALYKAKWADLQDAEKSLEAAQAQFEAGVQTILDVLQARTTLVNVQLQLVQLQGQVRQSLGNLVHALGWDAHLELNIMPFPDDFPLEKVSDNVAMWSEVAKQNRFDLLAAQENYREKKSLLQVAKSAPFPKVFLLGSYNKITFPGNSSFNNSNYQGSIQLNAPIFHGFFYKNQIKEAREVVHQSLATMKIVESDILLQVLTDTVAYATAVESYRYSEEYLQYSQEAYDAALIQYKSGVATILNVLSALATLSDARAQKIQAKTNWIVAVSNISYAAGVLGVCYDD